MNIICPHCHFTKAVDPDRIPDRPVRVKCPRCKGSFIFEKGRLQQEVDAHLDAGGEDSGNVEPAQPAADLERRIICSACGTVQGPTGRCKLCGATIVVTAIPVERQAYAGFWSRLVAWTVDFALRLVIVFAISQLLGVTVDLLEVAGEGDPSVALIFLLFSASVWVGYAVFFTGYCGQTPGKMALRIKVVRADAAPIGYGRAVVRELIGKTVSWLFLGIGFLMIAVDGRKQGLHDKVAGSCVINI